MSEMAGWEHFWHMADIGVHGWGSSLNSAFEQGALALTGVVTDPESVETRERVEIHCQETDLELLFMEWLNALVFEMATRRMLFSRFSVRIEKGKLAGQAWGEGVDVARHQPAVEVKGATVTCLEVAQDERGIWHARCVVDV